MTSMFCTYWIMTYPGYMNPLLKPRLELVLCNLRGI